MKCLNCKHALINFFNLGELPPSDYFAKSAIEAKKAPSFNLSVGRCTSCNLVQNQYLVSANLRYRKLEYSYNSANSNYAKNHWQNYVNKISKFFKNDLKFLDIGCNDGYLSNLVQKETKSNSIYGLDASNFQIYKSKKKYRKINFFCGYGEESSKIFKKNYFDIITLNNVFNHSSKPFLFLQEIKKILNKNGLIVIEVPNWIKTVEKKSWDQIYHEHVLYFTPYTIAKILVKAGFKILKIYNIEFHGGSLRVLASKSDGLIFNKKKYKDISLKQCKKLAKHALDIKIKVNKKVNSIIQAPIYLFGAPAKGNTLINYFGLNYKNIKACLETSKNKIGKYMPKSCIPIIAEKKFIKKQGYILNLSWNIPFIFKNFCKKNNLKILKI
jgi:2-polyprenyl-3-methyl-5-hydroxy-6-metoxy-1,4-benzoquinol methylase